MTDGPAAFVLAAGLGERLRPITHHIPKPLLPVAGRPVLDMILERLVRAGASQIGINLHYRARDIDRWLSHSPYRGRLAIYREDPILGTGGALRNAANLLSENTFIVHNADIISTLDLGALLERHRSEGALATLAVHDLPRFNNVIISEAGLLRGVSGPGRLGEDVRHVAFTGVAVYEAAFLDFIPPGVSGVVDAWLAAARAGHRIITADFTGAFWTDIGTPGDYASAVISEMRTRGETIVIHPSSPGCQGLRMDGYVVIEENCTLGRDSSLRNCIVLPGSSIPPSSSHENRILGPGFALDLDEAVMLGTSPHDNGVPIGSGGSDRQFVRVAQPGGTAVLLRSTPGDPDLRRQVEYTGFFERHGLPVPKMIRADLSAGEALFEDLGDLSLYSWLRCPRDDDEIECLYRKVLDLAVTLHAEVATSVGECPLLRERVFDYGHLRWETFYFMERFVRGLCNAGTGEQAGLDEEFHRLAIRVDSLPKTVVHRDFQCQNIMVGPQGVPRPIDYQGARMGPAGYDVASVLWDPYFRLSDRVRTRLLSHYIDRMTERAPESADHSVFRESLLPCRLQRHMQALGAYGYLSLQKGKKHFLKHVPEGLRLLKEDLEEAGARYPVLSRLVLSLGERWADMDAAAAGQGSRRTP